MKVENHFGFVTVTIIVMRYPATRAIYVLYIIQSYAFESIASQTVYKYLLPPTRVYTFTLLRSMLSKLKCAR